MKKAKLVGSSDMKLWKLARKENRIIVSFDLDFANIIQYPPSRGNGVIVIRPKGMTFNQLGRRFKSFISKIDKIGVGKSLVVISRTSTRVRR